LAEFEKAVQALESVLILPEDDVVRDVPYNASNFVVLLITRPGRLSKVFRFRPDGGVRGSCEWNTELTQRAGRGK